MMNLSNKNYLAEAIIMGKRNKIINDTGSGVIDEDSKITSILCKEDNINSVEDFNQKYTCEEFESAIVSCASYAIYHALNEAHLAIRAAAEAVKDHRLNNGISGFKKELKRLLDYNTSREHEEMNANGKEMIRIKVMNKFIHEDLEENTTRLFYTIKNWLNSIHYPEADLMANMILAATITDFACVFIDQRIEEVAKYRPIYVKLKDIVPTRLKELVIAVLDKIASLIPFESDKDINESKEIALGIRIMESKLLDIDQMQYYAGAGIEAEIGKEQLLKESPKIYYLIHPMEDPRYLARKEKEELELLEKEEEKKKVRLAYSTRDVNEYEEMARQDVNQPLDISKVAELKGWKMNAK